MNNANVDEAMPRIVIADDDVVLRGLIAELLREHGYDVVEAADGATLLAALQRGGVSVVVTDLWMPSLSGADVLRLCRSAGDPTPFVIITAAPVRFTEDLLAVEHVAVLRKPFAREDLLRAISTMLQPP